MRYTTVGAAMRAGDWGWVAGWVSGRFDVTVDAVWCERKALVIFRHTDGWPNHIWAMWWKNRVEEDGMLAPAAHNPPAFRLAVDLHVGFLQLEETDEQLGRLYNEKPLPDDEERPATPKIERTLTMPTPIDRVAARVVGIHPGRS